MAQTGDPSGTGAGGESIFGVLEGNAARYFARNPRNRLKHARRGTVSLVATGDGMHGSQFCITLAPEQDSLNGQHAVFGEVAEESYSVLDKLNAVYVGARRAPRRRLTDVLWRVQRVR